VQHNTKPLKFLIFLPSFKFDRDFGSDMSGKPGDFLKSVIGRSVVVKLNSGTEYHGVLACLDGFMNIAMEQAEEFVGGQLKAQYADAFIRGNNVLFIRRK
jgi:U6 snRNA-associated Sm-like protein LSm6